MQGGYITIIVWGALPGIRLGDSLGPDAFWSLPLSEREAIRKAFQPAYKYAPRTNPMVRSCPPVILADLARKLGELGYYPSHPSAKNLLWDATARRMYVFLSSGPGQRCQSIGFRGCNKANDESKPWKDSVWARWRLGRPPMPSAPRMGPFDSLLDIWEW